MASTPQDKNSMEVDFRMRYFIVSFDSVEDRDNFLNLINNMGNEWQLHQIANFSGGWLLSIPSTGVADRIVKFLFEKGVIHEYRETSA